MRNTITHLVLGLIFIISLNTTAWSAESASVRLLSDKGSAKTLQAEALVDAPIETVWDQLTDYGKIKTMLPGYDRSTVLQSGGNTATVDIGLKASGLAPAFRYQVKVREDKAAHTIHIQRISGDFKTITASYKLIPVENGTKTKVVYKLDIDLGNIPTLGAGHLLKSNTEKVMIALQGHCSRVHRRSLSAQK
ncbi:MAG TPA: SRPBCC family protein [Coleofasciculaceae cyanobacterium]|jgi:carbon monoxide dehydrogenase subunit G